MLIVKFIYIVRLRYNAGAELLKLNRKELDYLNGRPAQQLKNNW